MGTCTSKRAMDDDHSTDIVDQPTPVSNRVKADAGNVNTKAAEKEGIKARVIFVSLFALLQCWDDIPTDILSDSVICINGRRNYFFPKTSDDIVAAEQWPLFKLCFSPMFRAFIRCKDAQGSIIWMASDAIIDSKERSASVAPSGSGLDTPVSAISRFEDMTFGDSVGQFGLTIGGKVSPQWQSISRQLSSMIDPSTNAYYKGLPLSPNNVTLSVCSGNYAAMMAIFAQSNSTLIPMIQFDSTKYDKEITRRSLLTDNSLFDNHSTICVSVDTLLPKIVDISKLNCFGDIEDANGFVYFTDK